MTSVSPTIQNLHFPIAADQRCDTAVGGNISVRRDIHFPRQSFGVDDFIAAKEFNLAVDTEPDGQCRGISAMRREAGFGLKEFPTLALGAVRQVDLTDTVALPRDPQRLSRI